MKKIEKSKLIKTILLLLSTLLFPLQFFSIAFYFIPSLYIGVAVPYLIWKIWFNGNNQKIKKYSLVWKIPLIILLSIALLFVEMLLIFHIPITLSLFGKIVGLVFLLLSARSITYAMMIFVWQSDILVPYRKLIYAFILAYSIVVANFWYLSLNAPDTDDYSVSFSEYMGKI